MQGSSLLLPSGEEAKVKYDGSRRALHHYPSASEWSNSPAAELAVSPQGKSRCRRKPEEPSAAARATQEPKNSIAGC